MRIADSVAKETSARYGDAQECIGRIHALAQRIVADGHASANTGTEKERLALFLLARATRNLHAVETLFAVGLEGDAVAALRTLTQLTIDFDWIWAQDTDERLRLYVEYIHVINHRKLEASERIFGPHDPTREEAAFKEIAAYAPPG